MPKQAGGDRRSENFKLPDAGKFENEEAEMEKPKPKLEVAADMGFNKNQVALSKIELGKRFNELPKADNGGANQYQAQSTRLSTKQKPKSEVIAELGFTQKQVARSH